MGHLIEYSGFHLITTRTNQSPAFKVLQDSPIPTRTPRSSRSPNLFKKKDVVGDQAVSSLPSRDMSFHQDASARQVKSNPAT